MTRLWNTNGHFTNLRPGGPALLVLWALLVPAGCDRAQDTAPPRPRSAIASDDECHVCGMIIVNYPGPKGEAYMRGAEAPYKFCSTRDLFSFLLQPETAPNVDAIYVHDMAQTTWEHPADGAFVPAQSAFYVAGHALKGAMGPTLASFKERSSAEAFAREYGGRVLRYGEITLKLLADLESAGKTAHND